MSSALRIVASRASTSPLRLRPGMATSPTSLMEGFTAASERAVSCTTTRRLQHVAPEGLAEPLTPRTPRIPPTPRSPTSALASSPPPSIHMPRTPPPGPPALDNSIGGPITSMAALALLGVGAYTLYDEEGGGEEEEQAAMKKTASLENGPERLGDGGQGGSSSGVASQMIATSGDVGRIVPETNGAQATALLDQPAPPSTLPDSTSIGRLVRQSIKLTKNFPRLPR